MKVPLVNEKPILGAYFLILLLAVGIIFMNLVTASIVEASLQSSELDRKEKKISLDEIEQFDINILPPILRDNISVDNMADLFGVLDVDGGGELDMKEFIGGLLQLWLMDVPITTLQILKFSRMNRQKTMEYFTSILHRMEEMAARMDHLQGDLAKTQLFDSRF
ncbi:hypothetical protein AK812_SmicGene17262 [Symbiodinium microadriaticum]|uniref:EF-hand domain-containing protein n=1 Tax=Symbiodinium microadriaticum TaxID=2951 RepID=A0A1Q9DY63_SYMMI|nr:hypothetical protein AK812_SmicGene17262 [Symbiodinium microadriaticum]